MNGKILFKSQRSRASLGDRYPALFRHGWSPIDRTLKVLAEGVAELRRVARLYDELAAMTDPELHDIGINRADIPAVISGAYRRLPPPIPVLISSSRRDRSPSSNCCAR
jgi:uncharacterized protein YjiS (DUF1127 family)